MADPLYAGDEPTHGQIAGVFFVAGATCAMLWMVYAHTCPTPAPEVVGESVPAEDPIFVAEVTAYSPRCKGCSRHMYNGERPDPAKRTVAAYLPSWPIGSCVELLLPETGWARYIVADTGSAIDAENKFDLLLPTQRAARKWGRKHIAARRVECA